MPITQLDGDDIRDNSVSLTNDITGVLPVSNGGTGANTLTGVIIGNGTSSVSTKVNPTGAFVGTTDTQTLTNKTIDLNGSNTISNFINSTDFLRDVPRALANISKDPTGFLTPLDDTTATLSFTDLTRTFAITPVSGTFDFYVQGVKYTSNTQSIVIPATEGKYYFYFDNTGNIQYTTTLTYTICTQNCLIAEIYWDNTNSTELYLNDMRGGLNLNSTAKVYNDNFTNANWISGFDFTNFTIGTGTLATDTQFQILTGSFQSSDCIYNYANLANPSQIPIFYRSGASALWRAKTADNFPLIYSGTAGYTGANGRIPYNKNTAGTWSLVQIPESCFVPVHYYAITDKTQKVVGFQGLNFYSSVRDTVNSIGTELSNIETSIPMKNYIYIGTVIFQSTSTFTNTSKSIVCKINSDNYYDGRSYLKLLNSLDINKLKGVLLFNKIARDPNKNHFFWEDFQNSGVGTTGTSNVVTTSVGTGASTTLNLLTTSMRDAITPQTGTTATGSSWWKTNNGDVLSTNTTLKYEKNFYFDLAHTASSNATNRYTSRIGLASGGFVTDGTGIYFRYTDTVNSGNMQCVVRNGATESVINSTVAGGLTKVTLRIQIIDGKQVYFYINDILQNNGDPIITNIVLGTGMSIGGGIVKSVGTTSITQMTDYVVKTYEPTLGSRF